MLLNKCELKITVYTKDDISKLNLFLKMRQQNDSQSSHLIIRYHINFWNHGIYIYRRTLFKCESLIIANCEFFPQSHLKERNKRVSHLQTT